MRCKTEPASTRTILAADKALAGATNDVESAVAESSMASIDLRAGRTEEARQLARTAYDRVRATVGVAHYPAKARVEVALARTLPASDTARNRLLDDALEHLEARQHERGYWAELRLEIGQLRAE